MKRRHFLSTISIIPLLIAEKNSAAQPMATQKAPIKTLPIAGFEFYHGEKVWAHLEASQPLELIREPDTAEETDIVSVNWHGYKLGYIANDDNTPIAKRMDMGQHLTAKITQLKQDDDPWERIEIAIYEDSEITTYTLH